MKTHAEVGEELDGRGTCRAVDVVGEVVLGGVNGKLRREDEGSGDVPGTVQGVIAEGVVGQDLLDQVAA
jgi:hypothetical protein